jgi:hypothetical protein
MHYNQMGICCAVDIEFQHIHALLNRFAECQ